MVTDTTTSLHDATDLELDAALQLGFRQHKNATDVDRPEIHAAIVAILAEQGRRLDGWLDHTLTGGSDG